MKKTFDKGLSVVLVFLLFLSSCSSPNQEQSSEENTVVEGNSVVEETFCNETQSNGILKITEDSPVYTEAMVAYEEFLRGERTAIYRYQYEEKHFYLLEMLSFAGDYTDGSLIFTLFDMNGDGLPELHIKAEIGYYIFTYNDANIVLWRTFLSTYCWPTSNGGVIYVRHGAGDIKYQYTLLDFWGNQLLCVTFEKCDWPFFDGNYTNEDTYIFEGVEVTAEQWTIFTEPYLIEEETVQTFLEWRVVTINI